MLPARARRAHGVDADVLRPGSPRPPPRPPAAPPPSPPRYGSARSISVAGTRCTRCTPDSNLSAAKTPLPRDLRHELAVAAELGRRRLDHLPAPAARLRQPLVHARQIGGEERRLLAAGPGADLQDRRPLVGVVPAAAAPAAPPAPPPGSAARSRSSSSCASARISGSASSRSASASSRASPRQRSIASTTGFSSAYSRDSAGRSATAAPGVQPRLEELEARADLVELLLRDHAPRSAREAPPPQGEHRSAAAPAGLHPPPEGEERRAGRPAAPPPRSPPSIGDGRPVEERPRQRHHRPARHHLQRAAERGGEPGDVRVRVERHHHGRRHHHARGRRCRRRAWR